MRELTQEVIHRVMTWQIVLQHAKAYLAVAEHLTATSAVEWLSIEFYSGSTTKTVVGFTAQNGLHEAAIVNFRQVYTAGRAGPGFASNHESEVKRIRAEMERYVCLHLNVPLAELEKLLRETKEQRDEGIAHYDGGKAEFRRIDESVNRMRLPGGYLLPKDVALLTKVISSMLQFIDPEVFGILGRNQFG